MPLGEPTGSTLRRLVALLPHKGVQAYVFTGALGDNPRRLAPGGRRGGPWTAAEAVGPAARPVSSG
ncbi:hypothetical protein ACWC0C_45200 [Streptomyces sp. NPDC001709]